MLLQPTERVGNPRAARVPSERSRTMPEAESEAFILFEVTAKPDAVETVKRLLTERFPDTRKFDGYRTLDAYVDRADGRTFTLVQSWASREHYDTYLAWREAQGDLADFLQYVEGEPRVRFFDHVDA